MTPRENHMHAAVLPDKHPWPFSQPELTAGLRRRTGDPTLRVLSIEARPVPQQRPSVGRIRGVYVSARGSSGAYTFHLVLKEPQQSGITLAGSIGPAMREAYFYRMLAGHLPVRTPQVYAMHPEGEWLLLECLEDGLPPETWGAAEYLRSVEQIQVLHDCFWGLGDDLRVYNWLGRPLDANLEVHRRVAERAAERLLRAAPAEIQNTPVPWASMFSRLVAHTAQISAALHEMPATLLHGDYWPGNIHMDAAGRLTVYDWQRVSIGPGILDLISLVQTTRWWFREPPVATDVLQRHYRQGVAQSSGQVWTDEEWRTLWGYGLLWVFLSHWLGVLGNTPAPILQTQSALLQELWLQPIAHWLDVFFPEA